MRTRWFRSLAALAGAAALTLTAGTACSSSATHGGAAGSTSATAGASPTTASGSTASGGALAQARAGVAAALTSPTAISVTDPLTAAPPTGRTIIYLQCEVAQCVLEGNGLHTAAEALGWTFRTLNFQAANPATLVTAMNTALQYKPIAVFFSGVPYSVWQGEVPKYKAAGTYIVPSSVPGLTPDSTVITSLAADALYQAGGKLIADEAAADSNGTAKILFTTVPAYTIFQPLQQGYEAELKAVCPGCTSTVEDATVPQVTSNQMVPAIVSALKRDSSIDYVLSSNGDFVQTLPSALQSAGLAGRVKIITFSGTSAVQGLVKSGQIESTTGFGYGYEAWLGVDAVLRAMQGLPISSAHLSLPIPLLTKANVGTPADSIDLPSDYQQQFKTLWKLGA